MSNYDNQTLPQPTKIVRFDKGYIKTMPGILKLVQLTCNLIGFICIKVSFSWISSIFFNILYWTANIITLLLLFMYTMHFVEKYNKRPWHKLEFFYCAVVVLAYLACTIFAATIGDSVGYAVMFFGLCAMIAYGLDGYLKYKGWKSGATPQ